MVEAEAVTLGHDDVGVVQEPVDGGGGEGFGHDLVEAIWGWLMFAGAWLRLVPGQKRSRLIY
ncbi:hypothetical protein GCM10022255_094000 [Dactylosporangium darangshiense]|uniref:Uncharacterized protein n=1 Tax=Dactylosporangium darangshiense TaxID=579108 RepID=A0ABP8DPZ0_9ACTN